MAKHLPRGMSNYLSLPVLPESPTACRIGGMGLVANEIWRGNAGSESLYMTTTPNPQKDIDSDLIKHELLELLGETTNSLIFCHLDNNMPKKFTRVEIREAVERHVAELARTGTEEQHLPRIQTGKAAVNYWIDRLVERNSLSKEHSKPVLFWRSARYSKAVRNAQTYPFFGVGR